MDEIVRQAMAKWPDVPHCFGWLRLDARGAWRMRDERAQALDLPGEAIRHPALLGFINRNYRGDEQGRWYFQNGPQRVYVDLALAPYIVHTLPGSDGEPALALHTGAAMTPPHSAWMDGEGRLYLLADNVVAALDDRDLAQLLPRVHIGGLQGDALEQALLDWLQGAELTGPAPSLALADGRLPLQRLDAPPAQQFGFTPAPRAL